MSRHSNRPVDEPPEMSDPSPFRELNSVEDAANGKCSAVFRGYYVDLYIQCFVPETHQQIPRMNLDYFVRILSMWEAILELHSVHGDDIQVCVFDGGYDTLFWRLRDVGINVSQWFEGKYVFSK
jgi:hypothetical protein